VTTNASIPCEIWTTRRSRRCAGERERGWRIEGEEWLTDGGVFGGASLQIWRTPVKKFFVLAESRVEEKKEKRGGDRGLFIGGRLLEKGLGLQPGGAMDGVEESHAGVGERGWRWAMIGGTGWLEREGGEQRTGSGVERNGPWAGLVSGPKLCPRPFTK
jgi:hypothetical protein